MSSDLNSLINVYLNSFDHLEYEIQMRLGAAAREFDQGELVVDDDSLAKCIQGFQSQCRLYWRGLGVEDPSHLKVFGHLLYSLTQLRDEESGDRIAFCGVFPPAGSGLKTHGQFKEDDFLRVHFHEFGCFTVVYEMLISAQKRRSEGVLFDPAKPPTNHRYTRSMVDYLRQWDTGPFTGDRSPFDLYMIFKTMDLYGVNTAYEQ